MSEASPTYVGFWRRTLAATIDNATWLVGFAWLFGDAIGVLYEESPEAAGILVLVFFSAWFNYFALSEWRWGQTIGKNATGIKVTNLDGGRPSFAQASTRNLFRLVDFFFLVGPIMIAASERKQRLGDVLAKTLVVRRPRRVAAPAPAAPVPAESAPRPAPPPPAPEFRDTPYAARASGWSDPPPPPTPAPASGPRGALPSIGWDLRTTIWGLVGGFIAGLLAPLLVLPFDPELESDAGLLAAQALFGATLIAVAVGIAAGWRSGALREGLRSLGLRRFGPSAFGWLLLVMIAYYIGAGLFASFVLEPKQEDIGGELGACGSSLSEVAIPVLLIAALAPVSEELFFRGFLFSGLRSRLPLWPAALIGGAVFGLVHAPTGMTTVIPLAGLGVGLCWLYEKTGSLWPPIIAHATNNSLALALLCNT